MKIRFYLDLSTENQIVAEALTAYVNWSQQKKRSGGFTHNGIEFERDADGFSVVVDSYIGTRVVYPEVPLGLRQLPINFVVLEENIYSYDPPKVKGGLYRSGYARGLVRLKSSTFTNTTPPTITYEAQIVLRGRYPVSVFRLYKELLAGDSAHLTEEIPLE